MLNLTHGMDLKRWNYSVSWKWSIMHECQQMCVTRGLKMEIPPNLWHSPVTSYYCTRFMCLLGFYRAGRIWKSLSFSISCHVNQLNISVNHKVNFEQRLLASCLLRYSRLLLLYPHVTVSLWCFITRHGSVVVTQLCKHCVYSLLNKGLVRGNWFSSHFDNGSKNAECSLLPDSKILYNNILFLSNTVIFIANEKLGSSVCQEYAVYTVNVATDFCYGLHLGAKKVLLTRACFQTIGGYSSEC